MRDISSVNRFLTELTRNCTSFEDKFLRTSVFDSPSLRERFENSIRIKTCNQRCLQFLAIIHWYLESEKFLWIHLALEEIYQERLSEIAVESDSFKDNSAESSTDFDLITFGLLLQSRALTENFLVETQKWNQDEFFGFLRSNELLIWLQNKVKFNFKPISRPRETIRRRGYKDKGSLRPLSEKRSIGIQSTLQEKIETERQSSEDTLAFLQGWLM